MPYFLAAVLSYLSGSVPWALVVVRAVAGVDLRSVGSGNPGATNAARVVGKRWGALILLLDAAKGAVPTLLLPALLAGGDAERGNLAVACGLAAVAGHVFPVWLRFRGGKGVATGLGVAAVLHWPAALCGLAAFAAVAAATRLVALASTVAAWAFAAVCVVWRADRFAAPGWALSAFAVAAAALITLRHAGNFARMRRGEESRWGGADLRPAAADPGRGKRLEESGAGLSGRRFR